jgi:hypothetical protein
MSDGDIERIMKLAFCTEEEARKAYALTNDVIDAIDSLMVVPPTIGAPKIKDLSEEQQNFKKIRVEMEAIDRRNDAVLKKSDQRDSSSQELLHTPDLVQEGMMLRSDCTQESHLPTLEEEAKIPGTVCQ